LSPAKRRHAWPQFSHPFGKRVLESLVCDRPPGPFQSTGKSSLDPSFPRFRLVIRTLFSFFFHAGWHSSFIAVLQVFAVTSLWDLHVFLFFGGQPPSFCLLTPPADQISSNPIRRSQRLRTTIRPRYQSPSAWFFPFLPGRLREVGFFPRITHTRLFPFVPPMAFPQRTLVFFFRLPIPARLLPPPPLPSISP